MGDTKNENETLDPGRKSYHTGIVWQIDHGVRLCEELFGEMHNDSSGLIWRNISEIGKSLGYPIELDLDKYELLEQHGALRVYTARAKDGDLIGYGVYFLSPPLKAKGELHAYQDAIFIHPEWRKSWLGLQFIRYCDQQLESAGVHAIHQSVPHDKNFGPALKRLGYQQTQTTWIRRF